MTIVLFPVDGASGPVRLVADRLPAMIGRSLATDVPLGDPWVSHCHCAIDEAGGAVWVRDFGSTNGTWVNGRRIRESLLLPGDRLRIGASEFIVSFSEIGSPRHELVGNAEPLDTPRGSRRNGKPSKHLRRVLGRRKIARPKRSKAKPRRARPRPAAKAQRAAPLAASAPAPARCGWDPGRSSAKHGAS